MSIRPLEPHDQTEWLRLRRALWPDCSAEMHELEMAEYADTATDAVFVVAREDGRLGGFAEVSVRDRVDGSMSKHAAYLEGWYVDPDLRGQGYGRKLVECAERWALARGLTELASDAELDNPESLKAHEALGFRETFRLVHFLKPLKTLVGLLTLAGLTIGAHAEPARTRNLFLITVDGLRWQEVFTGAEALLMNKANGGVADTNRLSGSFWRTTPEERRTALLPFFWSVIGRQGQLYGNQNKGSVALLTNGRKFTYPGFNEILAGFADDRINKNEKRNNPNVTVFEWLHRKAQFTNRVVAFANWDVFPYILNTERSGIPMWTGYDTNFAVKPGSRLGLIQRVFDDTTPLWPGMNFDSFYLQAALEFLKESKPRAVWIAFSEPDEWAHEGRYDLYLYSAHHMDRFVRTLWETTQSMPEYRDQTTFILTCDHGRGSGPTEWRNHGAAVEGAEAIWVAIIGPGTPPLGERINAPQIGQNQIAATLAALLGQDYHGAVPKSGPPIQEALPPRVSGE